MAEDTANVKAEHEDTSEEERIKNVFNDLRHDFKEAKSAKTEIDEMINEWNDLYYGIRRNKDGERIRSKPNKSSIVMKEVAKQIEWQKPNVTEPFTSTRHPIQLVDPKDQQRSRVLEKWANHQFTQEFDREEFMDQLADVVLREGTVWVQTSWETREENERLVVPRISMEEILQNPEEPTEISQNADGSFKVEYNKKALVANNPYSEVQRNEHIFPDPSARTEKELRFMCKIALLTIPDIRNIPGIDQAKVDILESRVTGEDKENTALGQERDNNAQSYGYSNSYEPNDVSRKHIRIVCYWGYYDLNGDGIPEPIIAYWPEKYEIDLGIEENPMPDKAIPFDRSVYSARPFSLWGNALAFFLGDNQKAKTGMVRGIFDNMSLANNGQKFIARGALDYINFKRMNNGERYIITNKPDAITDGAYNSIPTSVFETLKMFTKESEDLSGVSSGGPALSNSNASKDGQQAQLTMSQQRMAAMVRNLSNLLRKIISKWVTMAEVFLTDEQILELFTPEEQVDMNVFTIAKKAKVKVRVGTEVNRNMKLQQYNMLMQQAKVLEGELPPGAMKSMVAEMYDLFDMHEDATKLRLYTPQPSEEEIALQQLQLQNAQLENVKLQTEIQTMTKDVEARYMNAQARMMEAQANYGYKGAQTQEKMAKAQAHKIDSAMKPVQVENEIMKTNSDAMKTQQK
jgi:hypothetical protein